MRHLVTVKLQLLPDYILYEEVPRRHLCELTIFRWIRLDCIFLLWPIDGQSNGEARPVILIHFVSYWRAYVLIPERHRMDGTVLCLL